MNEYPNELHIISQPSLRDSLNDGTGSLWHSLRQKRPTDHRTNKYIVMTRRSGSTGYGGVDQRVPPHSSTLVQYSRGALLNMDGGSQIQYKTRQDKTTDRQTDTTNGGV